MLPPLSKRDNCFRPLVFQPILNLGINISSFAWFSRNKKYCWYGLQLQNCLFSLGLMPGYIVPFWNNMWAQCLIVFGRLCKDEAPQMAPPNGNSFKGLWASKWKYTLYTVKEVYQRPRSLQMKRPQLNWDPTMADTKHRKHKKRLQTGKCFY